MEQGGKRSAPRADAEGSSRQAGPAARTVGATSPRRSAGTTNELAGNCSSLLRSGDRRGSSATAKTSGTPLRDLSRATAAPLGVRDAAEGGRLADLGKPAPISSCESGRGIVSRPEKKFSAGPPSSSSRRGPARANRLRLPLVPVGQKADRREDHRVCLGAEGVDGSTRPPGAGALDQRTAGEARKRRGRRARPPRSDQSDGAPAAARRQRLLTGEVVATESQELRGTPPGPRAAGRRTAVPSPSRSLPSSP